ncbi:YggT family protein [bacterium]|nr:YggT family protein [bacterium]
MTNDNRISKVKVSQHEPEQERRLYTFKATQLVWLLLAILEAMIAMRIGLKLIGANADNLIVSMVYQFTSLFLFPFDGLIGSLSTGNIVFELSSIFAMLVYALIAYVVNKLILLVFYRPRGSVVGVTETTTSEHHSTDIP